MGFLNESDVEAPTGAKAIERVLGLAAERKDGILFEHEVYEVLSTIGMGLPSYHYHSMRHGTALKSSDLPNEGPYVAKASIQGVTHKTDVGGILFNVMADRAQDAVHRLEEACRGKDLAGVLFVEQIDHRRDLGSEILLGMYQDPFFGPIVAVGFGGTSTEYYKDIMKPGHAQAFISAFADTDSVKEILDALPVARMLRGDVRGAKPDVPYDEFLRIVAEFQKLARHFSCANPNANFVIEEMEVNPAVARGGKLMALDGVLRASRNDKKEGGHRKPIWKIRQLLDPKSVAVAGASGKNPSNPSNTIIRQLLSSGLPHEAIYVIHPKEESVEGVPCVKGIADLMKLRGGRPVDCLVVGVPAAIAGDLIMDAFERNCAHSIQIIAAGFGETKKGKAVEQRLSERLAELSADPEKRPIVNGPNTLGNIYRNKTTLFTPKYKSSGTGCGKSNAALVCQSGAFMITRISDLADEVAPAVAISVGNQMDLSVVDFLEFLLGEGDLDCLALYVEGLKHGDGMRLIRFVSRARELGKMVVIYKAGRTKEGMEAAKGHTAAMAGDYRMFSELMRRAGAVVADLPEEFDDMVMLATYLAPLSRIVKSGGKIGIAALSNAGFEKCMIADHLMSEASGVCEFAKISRHTADLLAKIFDGHGVSSIIDQMEVLDLSPMMNDDGFDQIIRATLADESVDFGIYSLVPETVMLNACEKSPDHGEDVSMEGSIMNRLVGIRRDVKKPFVVSIESGGQYDGLAKRLFEAGIPTFRSAAAAAKTVARLFCSMR